MLLPAAKRLSLYKALSKERKPLKRLMKPYQAGTRKAMASHLKSLRKQAQKETGKTGRALYRG